MRLALGQFYAHNYFLVLYKHCCSKTPNLFFIQKIFFLTYWYLQLFGYTHAKFEVLNAVSGQARCLKMAT